MRKVAFFAVVLALAVTAVAFAQAKPDFSGTWALDAAKSDQMGGGGGGGRGPGGAGPMTIKQTPTEFAVTRGENTTTYKLDGTEHEVAMGQRTGKATAKVDAGKVVIKTVFETPNGSMEQTATYSLSADGKELTVVSASQRGERKMVYTKQ
ncbi:MAG: hypothetical protein EHM24_02140 [Acidobacteria bacterium]|nr:MAG: hypothetical protein EHM24_25520 [Acidobacteriota bacterium]RPJ76511.1 MAG: hypothetical protein EHM24_02140 [Acidobacteriota bacterium]